MDILQKTGILPGNQVLDIGFRDVANLKAIAEIVGPTGQVTGIDVDNKSVEQAKRELLEEPATTIQIKQGSILSIPASDNSFGSRSVGDRLYTHLAHPRAGRLTRLCRGIIVAPQPPMATASDGGTPTLNILRQRRSHSATPYVQVFKVRKRIHADAHGTPTVP